MFGLAQVYDAAVDAGLRAATISYGRLYLPVRDAPQCDPDDWEFLFLQAKTDLLDAFYNLLTALTGLTPADPSCIEAQHTFDIISALQALPSPPRCPDDQTPPTAFLNCSLLTDYQYAYNLSEALTRALPHGAVTDNACLERISTALHELDADLDCESSQPSAVRHRDPGAFRLLLGSGVHHDCNNGISQDHSTCATKGATATPFGGAEIATASGRVVDSQVEEVRAIRVCHGLNLWQHHGFLTSPRTSKSAQKRRRYD